MRSGTLARIRRNPRNLLWSGGLTTIGNAFENVAAGIESAQGSTVHMNAEAGDSGTVCHMWLGTWGSWMGLTDEVGNIRGYMQKVGKGLQSADPGIQISKLKHHQVQ